MSTNNRTYSLWLVVAGLFAAYLILKWTCRLIFGLLDYAIFVAMIVAVGWYLNLPTDRRKALHRKVKSIFSSFKI